jgi:hypothetical protein
VGGGGVVVGWDGRTCEACKRTPGWLCLVHGEHHSLITHSRHLCAPTRSSSRAERQGMRAKCAQHSLHTGGAAWVPCPPPTAPCARTAFQPPCVLQRFGLRAVRSASKAAEHLSQSGAQQAHQLTHSWLGCSTPRSAPTRAAQLQAQRNRSARCLVAGPQRQHYTHPHTGAARRAVVRSTARQRPGSTPR